MLYYNFLNNYINKGYVNNGVTLPFLIGINNENLNISELIYDLSNLSTQKYISIQKCGDIDEIIVGIYIDEGDIDKYKRYGSLICLEEELFNYSQKEFTTYLESSYQHYVDNSEFSKNGDSWSDYTEIEKERIKECLI